VKRFWVFFAAFACFMLALSGCSDPAGNSGSDDNTDVAGDVAVTGIALDSTNMSLYVGATGTLVATVSPSTATNKSVAWSSSNPAVATVNSIGVVTTVSEGTTDITATTVDGNKVATCTVVTTVSVGTTGLEYYYFMGEYWVFSKGTADTTGAVVIPAYYLGKPVTIINTMAFSGCSGMTSITIPNTMKTIRDSVFQNCTGLTNINLPSSVSSIGDGVFSGCTSLASITVDSSSNYYKDIAGVLYSKSGTTIRHFPMMNGTTYAIPDGVTTIGKYAFDECVNLTSIALPSSITLIDSSAFSGCSGLTSLTIPSGVTDIGFSAFSNCIGIASIAIPGSVTTIGNGAFSSCRGLTSIVIPSTVATLGQSVFSGCWGLTSATIDGTSTGNFTFIYCSGLTTVYVNQAIPPMMGSTVFAGCTSLAEIRVPSANVADYKAATGWSNYALYIVSQ
jgi:hypothetical protein